MARGGMKFMRGPVKGYVNYFLGEHGRGCFDHGYYGAGQRWLVDSTAVTLDGPWDATAYAHWLGGRDPLTAAQRGRAMVNGDHLNAVRGYEFSVNMPKSASIMAALDPELALALIGAQERAAQAGLQMIARRARTRITRGGVTELVSVSQLEVAVFCHDGSREGDPHQHLHVQVGPKVFVNGKWYSLAGRTMAGAVRDWQSTIEAALATDRQWISACAERGLTVGAGGAIVEIPVEWEQEFSVRHRQIVQMTSEMVTRFRTDHQRRPNAKELRAIDQLAWERTRPRKGEVPLLTGAHIRDRLIELGAAALLERFAQRRSGIRVPEVDVSVALTLAIAEAESHAVLSDDDLRIVAGLGIAAAGGACDDVLSLIDQLALRVRASCIAVEMPGGLHGWVSARVMKAAEVVHEHLGASRLTAQPHSAGARELDVQGLSPGQLMAAEAIALGLPVVVEGPAGTGKTTALRRALDARNRAGLKSVAVAPSAVAVEQLGDGWTFAGTVHALLIRAGWSLDDASGAWQQPQQFQRMDELTHAAIIVDEAGMLDLHTMSALVQLSTAHAARVVMVGDDRQLGPVGVAGGFALATKGADAIHLRQVQRFHDPNHGDLAALWRSGTDVELIAQAVLEAGCVVLHDSEEDAQVALAEIAASGNKSIVMAADNLTAVAINRFAHAERSAAGQVHAERDGIGRYRETIGVGDLVQTRRNDNIAGVINRQRWIVRQINEDGSLRVARANNHAIEQVLDAKYVADHVHRADAVTVHGAQGATGDHAHALIDHTWSREQAYVALTRGRNVNQFHIVASDVDEAREILVAVLEHSDRAHGQVLADLTVDRVRQARRESMPTLGERINQVLAPVVARVADSWRGNEPVTAQVEPRSIDPPPAPML